MTTENVTGAITSPARLESNISSEHAYSHVILINVVAEKGRKTMGQLIGDFLQGCGRVDLVQLTVKYQTQCEKQTIKLAIVEAGSSIDVEDACGLPNGFVHVSNARNYGEQLVHNIVPDDNLSRQIRPVSADLPMIELLWAKTDKVNMWITVFIKVRGFIKRHYTLN